jgi:hypothetical protein
LSGLKNVLDPNETVIWRCKPNKKTLTLRALGGIPIALFFLGITSIFLSTGMSLLASPAVFTIPLAIILVLVIPLWQFRKYPHTEYMITNQRLILKTGISGNDVWFTELDKTKESIVKIGFADKIWGTGSLYPITKEYPCEPRNYLYTEGGMNRLKKVYNTAEQKYEEITEIELRKKTSFHPHLEGLKEPYQVQKLLKEVIFGAGTNFVNCEYCNYRYDLNKEEKCPHCGGTHPQNYPL